MSPKKHETYAAIVGLITLLCAPMAAAQLLLDGGMLPDDQGWSVWENIVGQLDVSTDGTDLTLNTIGVPASSFGPLMLFYRDVGLDDSEGFTVEWSLRVIEAVHHNQYDAGVAFFASYDGLFGSPEDRAKMIYFDEDEIGWADHSDSYAMDTTDALHTYRLTVDSSGDAELFVDDVSALERGDFTTNGVVAFGDQTNDISPSVDGHFVIRYIRIPGASETESKWSQFPHDAGEGFDAVSDLWWSTEEWEGIKWLQWPDYDLGGLHSQDTEVLAEDWLCDNSEDEISGFHWWGNYENDFPGDGINRFELAIYADAGGLPLEPPLWTASVPFNEVEELTLQVTNSMGETLYLYRYRLPMPFDQTEGNIYWFSVVAISNPGPQPPLWRWMEAGRVPLSEIRLNPAAWRNANGQWNWIDWTVPPPTRYSELAFMVVTDRVGIHTVNKVVADDFVSDGRPITEIKWWGSYWDTNFIPFPDPPLQVIDGWLITFHWADVNQDPQYPPDILFDTAPTVLGTYFASREDVEIVDTGEQNCRDHDIYRYSVDLSECCLICSEPDPRPDGNDPAQEGQFVEIDGFRYWMSIQAVTGVRWFQPFCDRVFTGHLPSLLPGNDGHYWGWHTSPAETMPAGSLDEAATGKVMPAPPDSSTCWEYGDWTTQPWLCPDPPPQVEVHMAFELLTPVDQPAPFILHRDGQPGETHYCSGYIDPCEESTNGVSFDLGIQSTQIQFSEPVFGDEFGGPLTAGENFALSQTNGVAPNVVAISQPNPSDPTLYQVNWDRPITLQEWTTVRARNVYNAAGVLILDLGDLGPGIDEPDRIDLGFLPCDVNQDGAVTPFDLLTFRQYVNGTSGPPCGVLADYVDVNRDSAVTPFDLLSFRQLVNGISPPATQGWSGATMHSQQP